MNLKFDAERRPEAYGKTRSIFQLFVFLVKKRVVDTTAVFNPSIWHRRVAEARSPQIRSCLLLSKLYWLLLNVSFVDLLLPCWLPPGLLLPD